MTSLPAAAQVTRPTTPPKTAARPTWLPVWSEVAMLRAVRAVLVIPGLFAFADQVVGNAQMATFASFGGFATLVLSQFGGTRRDKAVAHLGLALTGTALIVIGTAAASSTAAATLVTVPVAFLILFAGVVGPNAAAGATGALLAFVLPVVSSGGVADIPARLAGWWLVSVVGTAAVLILSPRLPADRLRQACADLASSLADEVDATLTGADVTALRESALARKATLRAAFTSTPYRPTGLATPDQALANLVELLEWSCSLADEVVEVMRRVTSTPAEDRALLDASSEMLRAVSDLLRGKEASPDLDLVEQLLHSAATRAHRQYVSNESEAESAHLTYHARNLAVSARAAATDCLIASRRADDATISAARVRWYGDPAAPVHPASVDRVYRMWGLAARHASVRSIWYINSIRGALALAAAVAVADLSNVQHAFWVVLGTLSVLRTNAATTGATALRAILGTAIGFVVGSALVIAIGTNNTALWIMLPIAVFVAAYAPGTAPFAVGQAAFTVLVAVLFNLLVPVGWKVGVVRIEDVALGCGVSVVVGVVFWPRGASRVVGNDMADAFRRGGAYLSESVAWVLGRTSSRPHGGLASLSASERLDDALRGFLTESGTKRVAKDDLWSLVGSTMRLRLTAHALANAHPAETSIEAVSDDLARWSSSLVGWYEDLASGLEGKQVAEQGTLERTLPGIPIGFTSPTPGTPVCTMWVGEHLRDLRAHLADIIAPAVEISALQQLPWWR